MDTNEIIEGVVARWERHRGIRKGERNGNLYILAADLNNHGVPQGDGLTACLRYVDHCGPDPLTSAEITRTVNSAYKRTQHGTKTWLSRGQYRTPGPRLPSPWTMPMQDRAKVLAMLVEGMGRDAEPDRPVMPLPMVLLKALPPALSPLDIFLRMATSNNALFTLAKEVDLNLDCAVRHKYSEGGNAPRAYPISTHDSMAAGRCPKVK